MNKLPFNYTTRLTQNQLAILSKAVTIYDDEKNRYTSIIFKRELVAYFKEKGYKSPNTVVKTTMKYLINRSIVRELPTGNYKVM